MPHVLGYLGAAQGRRQFQGRRLMLIFRLALLPSYAYLLHAASALRRRAYAGHVPSELVVAVPDD